MSDPYLYTVTNNVATFSINGAPWNLMSLEYIDRLEEQLPDVLADDSIRAIILTAEGLDHFSAGMDLKQIPEGVKRAGSPEAFFGQRHRVLDMIEQGGTPAIATLFGSCLGGGLEVALACDIRIAEEQAALALPEARVGLLPCAGGTQRLTQLVGEGWAKRMILCGERIGAQQAQTLGLVEEVVPTGEALATATALAAKVGNQSPTSIAACKRLIHSARNIAIADGLVAERDEFVALFSTEDQQEGTNAFLEKREPEWKNR